MHLMLSQLGVQADFPVVTCPAPQLEQGLKGLSKNDTCSFSS